MPGQFVLGQRVRSYKRQGYNNTKGLYAPTPDTFEADIQQLENLYSPADIVKYL